MFKAIILLTAGDDMSHDDFVSWWLNEHAPLARQLPKLRKATFNVVDSPQPGQPNGVSELWFDTQADFDAAYSSEIGKSVVADSMAHVSGRVRLIVAENLVLN